MAGFMYYTWECLLLWGSSGTSVFQDGFHEPTPTSKAIDIPLA